MHLKDGMTKTFNWINEQVEEAKLDELREEAAAQPVNLEGVTRAELDKLSTVLAGMSDLVDEVLDVELETEGQPAGLVEDQLEVATDVDTQAEAQQEDAFEGDFTDEHHQTLQAAFARVFIADNERPVDRELRLFNEERTRLGLRALPGRPARSGNK